MDLSVVAEDLVLLAMNPRSGRIPYRYRYRLGYALAAVELAALEAAGCLRAVADPRLPPGDRDRRRLIVTDPAGPPPGSAELDAALASITAQKYPPIVWQWLGLRKGMVTGYLERLAANGMAERRTRRRLGVEVTRWRITDGSRLAGAQARLTAVACGNSEVDQADALYAGLARGLAAPLTSGLTSRQVRDRLDEISASCWLVGVVAAKIADHQDRNINAVAYGG